MREKAVEQKIKKFLAKNKIDYLKVWGNGFQAAGWPDLLIFFKGRCYGLEVKNDLKTSKPSALQVAQIKKLKPNLKIFLVDNNNYKKLLQILVNEDYSTFHSIYKGQMSELANLYQVKETL